MNDLVVKGLQRKKELEPVYQSLIKAVEWNEEEATVYEVDATVEVPDRDGDVVVLDGGELDNYSKNPVMLVNHMWHELPVAKAVEIIKKKDRIRVKFIFAPTEEGQVAETLWKNGFLNAVSIGFIPKSWDVKETEDDYVFYCTRWELLEISFCSIPANQDALRTDFSERQIQIIEEKFMEPKKVAKKSKKQQKDKEPRLFDTVGVKEIQDIAESLFVEEPQINVEGIAKSIID